MIFRRVTKVVTTCYVEVRALGRRHGSSAPVTVTVEPVIGYNKTLTDWIHFTAANYANYISVSKGWKPESSFVVIPVAPRDLRLNSHGQTGHCIADNSCTKKKHFDGVNVYCNSCMERCRRNKFVESRD